MLLDRVLLLDNCKKETEGNGQDMAIVLSPIDTRKLRIDREIYSRGCNSATLSYMHVPSISICTISISICVVLSCFRFPTCVRRHALSMNVARG
jgi:hypothetical protein